MDLQPRRDPRVNARKRLLLGVIAILAACATGGFLAQSLRRPPQAASPVLAPPPPPRAAAVEESEPGEDRLLRTRRKMSVRDFLGVLESAVPGPLAREFVAEFKKAPEIRREFEGLGEPGEVSAADALARLRENPKFRALLLKYDEKPAFRAAWDKVTQLPEIDRLLNEDAPKAAAALKAAAAKAPAASGRAVRAKPAAARSGAVTASFRSAAAAAGHGRGGPVYFPNAGAPWAGAEAPPGGAPHEASAAPAARGKAGQAGPGTTPLAKVKDSGPSSDVFNVILSAFARSDPRLVEQLEQACTGRIGAGQGCDIVDLCRAVSLQRCRDACAAAGAACTVTIPPDPPPPPPPAETAGGGAVIGPCAGPNDPACRPGTAPNATTPTLLPGQTVAEPNAWGVSWVKNEDGSYAYAVHDNPSSLPDGLNGLNRTIYRTPEPAK